MQPCEVCGGLGVDAAGYCMQCRTFRGQPPANPGYGQPAYPQPTSGTPYPVQPAGGGYSPASAPPAPAAPPPGGYPPPTGAGYVPPPASAAPYPNYGGNYPTSGGAYPTSGGGYPPTSGPPAGYPGGYAAPQPPPLPVPRSRNSFAAPLIALSGTLALIVIAIVVVIVVQKSGKSDDPPHAGPGASPTPTVSSAIDACLLGTWDVTSISMTLPIQSQSLQLTGSGGEAKFRPDGTGQLSHSGTRLSGTLQGITFDLDGTGTTRFSLRTSGSTFSLTSKSGDGEWRLRGTSTPIDVNNFFDGAKYTCTDGNLVVTVDNSSGNASFTMNRTSRTA